MAKPPKLLRCRICGRSAYLPIAVPIKDASMPNGVDFIFSSRFFCLTCKNEVDIFDAETIEKHLDVGG